MANEPAFALRNTIGRYDALTGTVPVTFRAGDIVHKRLVNVCLDAAGAYDAAATRARVADVSRGIAAKIAAGIIGAPDT